MTQVFSTGSQTRSLDANMGFFARAAAAIADYRLFLATVEELRELSDRDLADLGLHRSSIRDIARESVYGA